MCRIRQVKIKYNTIYINMIKIVFGLLITLTFFSCNQGGNDTSKIQENNLNQPIKITMKEGIITKQSTKNFEETYATLVEVLTNNPNLKIIAELDHQANARSVDLELRPTRIIMFGNPKLGTPLMQSAQTTGLDLPQKIMVWQDDQGAVQISYNDPQYLQKRHGIQDDKAEVLKKISGALDKISNVAAGL